ncbi:unnamed protein product [Pedinophyceae sp. YPF-701]|nr:unnamed protein product [Pedinophyceae sp. YPF-701]
MQRAAAFRAPSGARVLVRRRQARNQEPQAGARKALLPLRSPPHRSCPPRGSVTPRAPLRRPLRRPPAPSASSGDSAPSEPIQESPIARACATFSNLFPLWVAIGAVAGVASPQSFEWFKGPLVVWGLAFTMLGMGLTLTLEDFARVARDRVRVAAGAALQFTIMPAAGLAFARLFGLDPWIAAGMVLVACCPGGTASNVVTFIAGADVPLSVAMTSCSTVSATVMTPLLTKLLAGTIVPVDAVALFRDIVGIVILPVLAGAALNTLAPRAVQRVQAFAPAVAVLTVALITTSTIARSAPGALAAGPALLAALFCLHASGFALGYFLSRKAFRFGEEASRTISIEVGMQNSTLGAVLAAVHLHPLAAVPCALSACMHSMMGSALAGLWRWSDGRKKGRGGGGGVVAA